MTTRRVRRVLMACALSNALLAGVGLAAASRADGIVHASSAADSSVVTIAAAPTTVVTAPPTTIAPAPVTSAAPTPTNPVASTTTRKKSSTKAAVAADDTSGIVSSAAPPSSSRVAPDAGSYSATFAGSATVDGQSQKVPSSGALVLTSSGGDLRQTMPGTPGGVALTERFTPTETDLVSFELHASNVNKTFTPTSTATFLRYDAAPGTTWSWTANSSDGKTHVTANGAVTGYQTINVGGEDVPTIQIETDITISGDITGTAHLTTWVSPTHRLAVAERQQINAKQAAGYGFTAKFVSDIGAVLTSLSPS